MRKFWRIFRHEYLRHVLRWRFVMALLSVPLWLLFMLGMMIISVMAQLDRTPVGYVDQAGLIQNTTLPDEASLRLLYAPVQPYDSEEAARAALEGRKIQAYYVLPPDFQQTRSARLVYREEAPNATATGQFLRLVQLNLLAGHPEAIALRVTSGATMTFETVGEAAGSAGSETTGESEKTDREAPFPFPAVPGEESSDPSQAQEPSGAPSRSRSGGLQEIMKMVAPIAAAVFLFSAMLTSSGYLMQAVVEEKENRTMEILATSASPATIMNGKITALTCVGLTQILFWAGPPAALLAVAKAYLPALPAPTMDLRMTALLIGTVVPTFVMISALMAAVGASVTEAREGQQMMSLFQLLLMSPFIVAVSIVARPDGPIALALSFFPMTASLTMLMRASFSTVPGWQIALSITVLLLSAVGALWLSGRVFRLGMLNYGKRLGWKDVLQAARFGGKDPGANSQRLSNRAKARGEEGTR